MKNIKHVWTVLCRKSVIDNDSQNMSIHEVLEKVSIGIGSSKNSKIPDKISIPFDHEVVSFWVRNSSNNKSKITYEVRIEIINPSGKVLGKIDREIVMESGIDRMRGRMKFNQLLLTSSGRYYFRLSCKEKDNDNYEKVAEIPLQIDVGKQMQLKNHKPAYKN